jgi:hypothetical protein
VQIAKSPVVSAIRRAMFTARSGAESSKSGAGSQG